MWDQCQENNSAHKKQELLQGENNKRIYNGLRLKKSVYVDVLP